MGTLRVLIAEGIADLVELRREATCNWSLIYTTKSSEVAPAEGGYQSHGSGNIQREVLFAAVISRLITIIQRR